MSDPIKTAKFDPDNLDTDTSRFISQSASNTQLVEIPEQKTLQSHQGPNREYVFARFEMETWNPDSLHWEAPTNATFYNTGRVYIFARRCANHRRHGVFNQGRTYNWRIDYQYLDENKVEIQASGLHLITLAFNKARNNADNEKQDDFLKNNLTKIKWVSLTRRIWR